MASQTTAKSSSIEQDIENIQLFRGCSADFFCQMARNTSVLKHTKGKVVFIHGEKAERFYCIKSGWVKLFRETLDGTQAIIDILTSGHVFGETSLFENGTYPYSAEIVENSEIISLSMQDLKTEIEQNNTLALNMLKSMARYRRQQDLEIEHLSIQNASQRIGCFLLGLAPQDHKGKMTLLLPYDKMLVASRLGMQPETFSRALAKLRDHTGIRVKGAAIEMDDINQLSDYCCSACSSGFPCKTSE